MHDPTEGYDEKSKNFGIRFLGRVNNEYLLCVIGYLNGCVKKGEGGYNWYI